MPLALDSGRDTPVAMGGDGDTRSNVPFFARRVRSSAITYFAAQLALMLEVGTPLAAALHALAVQTQDTLLRKILAAVVRDVEQGRQLSDALARYPAAFDFVFTSMVRAGETGGFMKRILDRMVELRQKRQALRAQLRAALTYPAVLSVLTFGVVIFILVAVLPKFMAFFEGKESILPPTTRFLMAASTSLRGAWWAYLLGLGLVTTGVIVFFRSAVGRRFHDWFLVNAPLLSRLSNKVYTCEFLRTLGNLLQSDVPLVDALRITRTTIGNVQYRNRIDTLVRHVEQGGRFAPAFAAIPFIPETVRQMVATGEEVGNMDVVMVRLAVFYDQEVEQDLKALAALIEPVALIVMGTVIGVIVSSVILPMFRLAHAIK